MKKQRSRIQAHAKNSAPIPADRVAVPQLAVAEGMSLNTLRNSAGLLSSAWNWIKKQQVARCNNKRLQVSATASLGEKRFVAVVEVDGMEFLVGGGPANVALLAPLSTKVRFGQVLKESINGTVRTQPADSARILGPGAPLDQVRELA